MSRGHHSANNEDEFWGGGEISVHHDEGHLGVEWQIGRENDDDFCRRYQDKAGGLFAHEHADAEQGVDAFGVVGNRGFGGKAAAPGADPGAGRSKQQFVAGGVNYRSVDIE